MYLLREEVVHLGHVQACTILKGIIILEGLAEVPGKDDGTHKFHNLGEDTSRGHRLAIVLTFGKKIAKIALGQCFYRCRKHLRYIFLIHSILKVFHFAATNNYQSKRSVER